MVSFLEKSGQSNRNGLSTKVRTALNLSIEMDWRPYISSEFYFADFSVWF
jgi:hypothetical protein